MAGFMDGFMKGYSFVDTIQQTNEDRARAKVVQGREDQLWEQSQAKKASQKLSGRYLALRQKYSPDELVNQPEFHELLKSPDFHQLYQDGVGPDVESTQFVDLDTKTMPGKAVPIMQQIKKDGSVSVGPLTQNRSSDDSDPVVGMSPQELDQMVSNHLAQYNPDIIAATKAFDDERTADTAKDNILRGIDQKQAAPTQTTAPGTPAVKTTTAVIPAAESREAVMTKEEKSKLASIDADLAKYEKAATGLNSAADNRDRNILDRRIKVLRDKREKIVNGVRKPRSIQEAVTQITKTASPDISPEQVSNVVESIKAPKTGAIKGAQESVSRIPATGNLTAKMKDSLIKLHKADPTSMPFEKLVKVLQTGRLTDGKHQIVSAGKGQVAVFDGNGQLVQSYNFADGVTTPEDVLELNTKKLQIEKSKLDFARTQYAWAATDQDGKFDEQKFGKTHQLLMATQDALGINVFENSGAAVIRNGKILQDKMVDDLDNDWVPDWFQDIPDFKSFSLGTIATITNSDPETVMDEYYKPVKARFGDNISPEQLDKVALSIAGIEKRYPRVKREVIVADLISRIEARPYLASSPKLILQEIENDLKSSQAQ